MGRLNKRFPQALVLPITAVCCFHQQVAGFAYAPNFITKIIAEQTGIEPVGLLEIEGGGEHSTKGTAEESKPITVTDRVKTRFPPEPNGYLHLGHAKAVSFNFAVARMFGGDCHMRLDDTNPSKEGQEYVDSILEDVRWIQSGLYDDAENPWAGPVRMTSDYFDLIYDCAMALIKQGDAYVDSLSAEEMKEYRGTLTEPGKDSPFRTRSIDENLELFAGVRKFVVLALLCSPAGILLTRLLTVCTAQMKEGKFADGEHVLRAKIDMASPNINMRDPALFRIKHESHQATGDKWCLYPMYDFSHPIADAVEKITHSLCTLEFEDHRPFYDWTIEKLLPTELIPARPQQIEFSRLNVKYTVLSKRKLIQLVEQNHVNGWDDPRMPTLSGMRRRGVPPSALRLFCERVGISKADSNIDFQVLEDCVRDEMDASCPRAFCVLNPLKVTITNWEDSGLEEFEVPRHPKIESMGDRTVPFGKEVFIERSDFFDLDGPEGAANGKKPPKGFKRLLPDGKVRLRYAYVISCDEVERDPSTQEPIELKCSFYPETRAGVTPKGETRVKGIIHWVEASTGVRCQVNQYDRLFIAEEPGKESGDYLNDINPTSLEVLGGVVVEPSVAADALALMAGLETEDSGTRKYHSELAYQFERSGYFSLDPDSSKDKLVLNRVVTLRDTWGAQNQPVPKKEAPRERNKPNPQNAGVVEDVRRVAFRAATILDAGPHPEADSLLLCKVDCGDVTEEGKPDTRTVVAGLAGKIAVDDLVGRRVVCVTNLKPAKMRGIESTAMLLAASDGGEGENKKVELLSVPESVPNGELISFDNKEPSEPDVLLKSKGALKVWDRVKSSLRANDSGEAIYLQENTSHRMMTSAGPVKTASLVNSVIQ
jgi:glutaminyl-tRNA synthetase